MTLIKWVPKNSILSYFNDVDRMFDNMLIQPSDSFNQESFRPSMDVIENESQYIIEFDLPGVEKKDVEVNSSDGILTIIAERKNEKNKSYIQQESQYGIYKRSFELLNTMQEDKIKANFKRGVLTLIVPKVEEVQPSIKKIAIS